MDYETAKEIQELLFPGTSELGPIDMMDGTWCPRDLNCKPLGLSEFIEACTEIILSGNEWKNPYQSYFELGTNVNLSGEIESIGKLQEWRASIIRGIDDGYVGQNNYFGATPEIAVARLYLALKSNAAGREASPKP